MAAETARYWRHAAVPGVDLLRARFVTQRPSAVAAEAGFADQAHPTRQFKRVVGVPPGAYQRERGARRRCRAPYPARDR